MYYTKKDVDDYREIFLPEHLTLIDRNDFIEIIEKFIKSDFSTLIINFKKTNVVDSAGLGFLLIARQQMKNTKKNLILKNPSRHVKKMFEVTNFDSIFTIYDVED